MSTTLSSLIDSLCELKLAKKRAEGDLKTIDGEIARVEADLMHAMDAEGVVESKNHVGKVALSESVYPKVEQWDLFGTYILDNRYLHLLERRPAVLAYRELLTLGKPVPGVLPFTKRKISFREA